MVKKNQESCESWLVEFWVIRRLKMQANFYQQFIYTTNNLYITVLE